MNGLLGLSGPQFLAGYLVALTMAMQWARVMRRRMRTVKGRSGLRPLSLDELAYLAGGPRRVIETAMTRLVESGALRLAENGTVRATGTISHDPVDNAVLADAGENSEATVTWLAARAARHDAVTAIGHRLAGLSLIVDPRVARIRLRVAVVPLLVVSAVGLMRLANDLVHGQPVGWLTCLLVITGAAVALFALGSAPHRTVLGARTLRQANTNFSAVMGVDCPRAGAARLVALGGLTAGRDLTV